jgi:hypothetical protein
MKTTEQELQRRLLYILHLGFVEVRNLALATGQEQIADLADAMEIIPRLINSCSEEDLGLIRSVLETYQDKYHASYDYPARLDEYDAPDSY